MSEVFTGADFDVAAWLLCLAGIGAFAALGWLISVLRRNVSLVDGMWSLMFLLALAVYLATAETVGWRAWLVGAMVTAWALRLSAYITWRNHGQPEDHRYQAIRRNNEPHFEFKSLYLVFGLQGALAWVICLPVLAAASGENPPGLLDFAGVALWIVGMLFEVVGDAQLARFRAQPGSSGAVLNTGLWRYTRHPNYFGEFTLWWGYYLLAFSAGAGWTVISPLLMSFLLLRVSGVTLLEKDIAGRRPHYRDYVRRTNAFFPGRPRRVTEAATPNGGSIP
jgi:steroid 5-alpha reductase family enzyme